MRKLIVSMNTTLDGYMSGPHCELDWHFTYWTTDMAEAVTRELAKAGTLLLGRITYQAMAAYWGGAEGRLSLAREDIAFAEILNCCEKVVFSRTLLRTNWHNTRLAGRNFRSEIHRLKRTGGRDILVFGSGQLVRSLCEWNMVDEYLLWTHPVVLGRGKPLFSGSSANPHLKLLDTEVFSSGVILLRYAAGRPDAGPGRLPEPPRH